ncbi:MAG: hydroxymethylpyrimidine/phosphomethylpyrimidine kinase [Alphaproteobacteria bacterium]|nr:hydroxymethylpyrimidine/phosphomethylpyrimidine kinase [Alphaproteobacteria bacterium]
MSTSTRDRVPVGLTIGAAESDGGSGVPVDLRTFQDHGLYGLSALTMVVARNTRGSARVEVVAEPALVAQIEAVLADFPVHVVKIGRLASAAQAHTLVELLSGLADPPPIVVDPALLDHTGDPLVDAATVEAIRDDLLPLAALATPTLAEAALLGDVGAERAAVEAWSTQAPCPLLVLGHGTQVVDVLVDGPAMRRWKRSRPDDVGFRGVGSTLSTAIASRLARGDDLETATDRAHAYVAALEQAALQWKPGAGRRVLPHGLVASPLADRTPLGAPWSLL